jgi:hypothetical protein
MIYYPFNALLRSMSGEISSLSINKKGFASLKTTIPMSVIKQWDLKPQDKLSWKWKVIDGEMVVLVTKYDEGKSRKGPKKQIKKKKSSTVTE